jgi:hypothetical protein
LLDPAHVVTAAWLRLPEIGLITIPMGWKYADFAGVLKFCAAHTATILESSRCAVAAIAGTSAAGHSRNVNPSTQVKGGA